MDYPFTSQKFQQALKEGRFIGQRCKDCNQTTFPPQATCASCQSTHLEETPLKGTGTLRTWTVIRVSPENLPPPYLVAMAELDEGPWVMGNLLDVDPESASLDLMDRKIKLGSQLVRGDRFSEDTWSLTFTLQE